MQCYVINLTLFSINHYQSEMKVKIVKRSYCFLAYQKSEVFALDRNSYLTNVILPMGRIKKKKKITRNSVCIGCIGRHVALSL